MGNFEKLSVLVIGVIIVMILVVALYTWTDDPAGEQAEIARVSDAVVDDVGDRASTDRVDEETVWQPWVIEDEENTLPTPSVNGSGSEGEVEPTLDDDASDTDQPAADEDVVAQEKTVTVKPGETLSHIAQRELGKASRWKLIAVRNDISDPAAVRAGMTLVIPVLERTIPTENKTVASSSGGSGPKAGGDYTVRGGDTIQKISQSAFGTIERWTDIWFANFERVEDPRFLRQGMTLTIPTLN